MSIKRGSKKFWWIGLALLTGALGVFVFWLAPDLATNLSGSTGSSELGPQGPLFNIHAAGAGDAADGPELETTGCTISGSVVDEQGSPVPGARVRLRLTHQTRPQRSEESLSAVSTGTGEFELEAVACGAYFIAANAPGLVSSHGERVELKPGEGKTGVRLVLSREGYRVTGTVVDQGGGGIPSATIRASQTPNGSAHEINGDEQGRYDLWLRSGNFWLVAGADGYAYARRRVTMNRHREVSFELEPAGTIRGRVIRREGGDPVAGAAVEAKRGWRPWVRPATTTSGTDGTFELTGLATGEYDVRATKGNLRGAFGSHVPVRVASYVPDVVIELKTGLAIRGKIVDDSGVGIEGATVDWIVFPGATAATVSGRDGAFELLGLEPGHGLVLAQKTAYVRGDRRLSLAEEDESGVEIPLATGVTVVGRVVNQNRQAIPGVSVAGRPEGGRGFGPMRRSGVTIDVTDGQGRFRLEGFAAGNATVRAQHLELGFATARLEDLEVGREYEVELTLDRGATVSGTVTWEDGEVAVGATVHASSRGMGRMGRSDTESDARGFYEISGLEAREYRFWAMRPGSASTAPISFPTADAPEHEIVLEADQQLTGIDFVLARADFEISGTVVDESGSPVADAEVGADLDGKTSGRARSRHFTSGVSTRSARDGSFTLVGLTRGSHEVWAELPGFPRVSVGGVDAGATGVTLTIPPGSVLAGVVVGVGGAPVSAYELRTLPQGDARRRSPWHGTDRLTVDQEHGSFEVRGLEAGIYRLVATTPSGQVGELADIEVTTGERRDGLRIEVTAGANLRGILRGHPSGIPLGDVSLMFFSGAGSRSATTDTEGAFEVDGLAPGEATVILRPDPSQYLRDRLRLTIVAGENEAELLVVELAALPTATAMPPIELHPKGGQLHIFVRGPTLPIAVGDQLLTIDGAPVTGLGPRGAKALMRGEAGTEVTLGVISEGSGEPRDLVLLRIAVSESP